MLIPPENVPDPFNSHLRDISLVESPSIRYNHGWTRPSRAFSQVGGPAVWRKERYGGAGVHTRSSGGPGDGLPVHFSILLGFARKGGDASHHERNRLFAGCLSLDAPLRRSSRTSAVLTQGIDVSSSTGLFKRRIDDAWEESGFRRSGHAVAKE